MIENAPDPLRQAEHDLARWKIIAQTHQVRHGIKGKKYHLSGNYWKFGFLGAAGGMAIVAALSFFQALNGGVPLVDAIANVMSRQVIGFGIIGAAMGAGSGLIILLGGELMLEKKSPLVKRIEAKVHSLEQEVKTQQRSRNMNYVIARLDQLERQFANPASLQPKVFQKDLFEVFERLGKSGFFDKPAFLQYERAQMLGANYAAACRKGTIPQVTIEDQFGFLQSLAKASSHQPGICRYLLRGMISLREKIAPGVFFDGIADVIEKLKNTSQGSAEGHEDIAKQLIELAKSPTTPPRRAFELARDAGYFIYNPQLIEDTIELAAGLLANFPRDDIALCVKTAQDFLNDLHPTKHAEQIERIFDYVKSLLPPEEVAAMIESIKDQPMPSTWSKVRTELREMGNMIWVDIRQGRNRGRYS
ncbi:MAG: hypothetical protein AB7G80_03420 [Dongiaceae bacterium]